MSNNYNGPERRQSNQDAYGIAVEALTKIRDHERVCAERYEGIERVSQITNNAIRSIYRLLWRAATAIIVLLVGIAGFLYVENNNNTQAQIDRIEHHQEGGS